MSDCLKRWNEVYKTSLALYWKQAASQEYDRNNRKGVYCTPVLCSSLPADAIVIQSLLAPSIKLIKHHPDTNGVTITFSAKHCIQGNCRSSESTPINTGNPTLSAVGFCQILANGAAENHLVEAWDYTNAFQHTIMSLLSQSIYNSRPAPEILVRRSLPRFGNLSRWR